MVRIRNSGWAVRSVFVWVMIALPAYAQTNTPPAWLAHETPLPANPVTDAAGADAYRFFEKYREAIFLVSRGQFQSAAITMDLLSHTLRVSPWLDIALLKHAQLNEHLNDRAAEDDYQLLRQRIANAPYFHSSAERARLFGVALNNTVENGINRVRLRRIRRVFWFSSHGVSQKKNAYLDRTERTERRWDCDTTVRTTSNVFDASIHAWSSARVIMMGPSVPTSRTARLPFTTYTALS